jgi:hypothetical protein
MVSSKQKKSENIQKLRENVSRSWWDKGDIPDVLYDKLRYNWFRYYRLS